jgi:hypothetical protein
MIAVLIIEDTQKDLDLLKMFIEDSFAGAKVEGARSVEEATYFILEHRNSGLEFDFVIADVIVPSGLGLNLPKKNSPEWDKMVNSIDRRRTKVILTSVHLKGDLHEVTIIEKGVGASERIVTAMAAHIVNYGIDEAFGRRGTAPFGREPDYLRGLGTIPLGRVTRNIYDLWKYLDLQQREHVRKYFDVKVSPKDPDAVESVNFGGRN